MEDKNFHISKELFVSMRQQNINLYYQVLAKELGKGAFGTVYKGRLKGTEGPWRAIKKIPKSMVKDSAMLLNQIQISISLDNPNIVKLYEIFQFNNSIYLVTDLCEGGQLFDRLDQLGCLNQKDARVIFRQMVQAINYLHIQNIAHRDLKPQNFLFLTKDSNNIKLIDFGLAMRWEKSLNQELKKKGDKKIIGTSYYLAPQILSYDYDERCDIWSLGVILYVLLTAAPPFDGENDKEILKSVKTMKYSLNIPQFNQISEQAKDLITKLLKPADQRIKLKQIFEHPWMNVNIPITNLKVSFKRMHEYSKYSKLKKITATFVASQMSEKEVQKLGQLFRKIDVNHDGFISIEELKLALSDQNSWIQMKQLKNLLDQIDVDKNASSISQEELFTPSNLAKMFKLLDKDGNGEIDKVELMSLFTDHNLTQINGKNIDEIIQSCDKDNSGTISFQQFKLAILF